MGPIARWRSVSAGKQVLYGTIVAAILVAAIAVGLAQTIPDSNSSDRAASAGDSPDGAPVATSEPQGGAQLFATHCASCHGEALEGGVGPRLDRGSDASELSDRDMRVTMQDGKRVMPSFSDTLTDAQIDEIVAYVREIQDG